MASRILLLDDQVMNENESKTKFKKRILERYGDSQHNRDFVEQCYFMTDLIEAFKDNGNSLIFANKFADAIKKIETESYDIAIVDLGWYMDDSVKENDKGSAGWDLCKKIDQIDITRGQNTAQIIFSSRFPKKPELSLKAASEGKIPVFKENNRFVINQLIALIQSIETNKGISDKDSEKRNFILSVKKILLESFREPIKEYKRWTVLTIIFVAISLAALMTSIYLVLFDEQNTAIITSISSAITGIITTIFFTKLNTIQKTIDSNTDKVMQKIING